MMKKITGKLWFVVCVVVLLFGCSNKKRPPVRIKSMSSIQALDVNVAEKEETPAHTARPDKADELFDDFIISFASDSVFQWQRTLFPLPYQTPNELTYVESSHAHYDSLFLSQGYYTVLLDQENELDLEDNTLLTTACVSRIELLTCQVRRYDFVKENGMWCLKSLNMYTLESQAADFYHFYARFSEDDDFQRCHMAELLEYITFDPDDEFAILETTMDMDQWFAFGVFLPQTVLYNIDYGQANSDTSHHKILKINGLSNGYSVLLYFRIQNGEWELYKYEDTSI